MSGPDYPALKAALAALPGTPTDAESAAALNAATVARARVIPWAEVRVLALESGAWAVLVVRARQTPTLPPATATDVAILAAINATSMDDSRSINPGDAASWAAFTGGLAALVAVGDIPQALSNAIVALGTEHVSPASLIGWPPVSEHDIAHARSI